MARLQGLGTSTTAVLALHSVLALGILRDYSIFTDDVITATGTQCALEVESPGAGPSGVEAEGESGGALFEPVLADPFGIGKEELVKNSAL